MTKNRKRLLAVLGLVLMAALVWSAPAFSQPSPQGPPPLEVSMSGSIRGDVTIYSVSLKNISAAPVQDIFVAGSVPAGAVFQGALDTPKGTWFRGYEGAGKDTQSAVWLAGSIAAGGTLGPFSYVVDRGSAADLRARAFVHFRLPSDGTAISPDVEVVQTVGAGSTASSAFHDTHTKKLGLSCNLCHSASAAGYSDPLANVANPVDKKACLGCHSSGPRPFYGEDWDTVRIR